MKILKLIEVREFSVPATDGEELVFRLEVLAQGAGAHRRYRCRLYRLESFRFRVHACSTGQGNEFGDADYRCWVLDENLGVEISLYPSIAKARNAAVRRLEGQLDVAGLTD